MEKLPLFAGFYTSRISGSAGFLPSTVEPENDGLVQMIFLFNWVKTLRFQPLIFVNLLGCIGWCMQKRAFLKAGGIS